VADASYEVIYDSDLIIRDRATLATLSIFYECVHLPWMPPELVQSWFRVRRRIGSDGEERFEFAQIEAPEAGEFQLDWDSEMDTLFKAEVLKRLPPVKRSFEFKDEKELIAALDGLSANFSVDTTAVRMFYGARVLHHLRDDLSAPRLFQIHERTRDREVFKALLAQQVFSYVLPAIQALEPEKILKVREKVRDTREGFAMHLQKLSKEVENRIQDGEQSDQIARYARSLVETEIVPDYREFRRQLAAERIGFWAKVLDKTNKIFKIEAPITSPRFWADTLAAIGLPLASSMERRRETLTNRHLAFQFLRSVELEIADKRTRRREQAR
jgi:hypothetical protein